LSLKKNSHKLYEKLTYLNLRYRSETRLSLFLMGRDVVWGFPDGWPVVWGFPDGWLVDGWLVVWGLPDGWLVDGWPNVFLGSLFPRVDTVSEVRPWDIENT